MKNALNWFEIPVKNFDESKKFYETVIGGELEKVQMDGDPSVMGFFPSDQENGVGGSIISGPGMEPAGSGTLVYLNGGDNLDNLLSKVEGAGGKIIFPKTSIGQHGFIAHFTDPDGNKVGLHSPN